MAGGFHIAFAVCTFIALGLMALRFAKRGVTPAGQDTMGALRFGLGFGAGPAGATTPRPEILAYRVSGCVILACVALAGLSNLLPPADFASWPVLFILETIAVVAFGVSWFVKGGTILPAKLSAK